jgi:hypothetical protein
MPVKTGIQGLKKYWIPASAGMTARKKGYARMKRNKG